MTKATLRERDSMIDSNEAAKCSKTNQNQLLIATPYRLGHLV